MTTGADSSEDDTRVVGGDDDTPYIHADADQRPPERSRARGATFGRYKLEETLGLGGMGVVYRAYDPMLERNVALKIVRPAQTGTDAQRRLFREAQVLAQVHHPNVVSVHDVGVLGRDVFVAMEFVQDTVTLAQWQKGRTWKEVLGAYIEAGTGLAAAHERGLVHRDVKPDNILIAPDGRVTVIDFGLATVAGEADDTLDTDTGLSTVNTPSSLHTPLTHADALIGTPRYMSPEQHNSVAAVDARSDQYNLAVGLYEAICGVWPFPAQSDFTTADKLQADKARAAFVPPKRKVPKRQLAALRRALAPDPEDRWPTMAAFLRELAPGRAHNPTWWAVLATLLVVATVAVPRAVRSTVNAEASARCSAAAASIDDVWNATINESIERAFAATGVGFAADTATRVARQFDERARKWASARQRVCEATWLRGEQSEALLDLRMGCLDRRRGAMAALISLFRGADVDGELVGRAMQATASLDAAQSCIALRPEDTPTVESTDPATRQRIVELELRVDELKLYLETGMYSEGLTRGDAVLDDARALGSTRLQAEALYYLSRMRLDRSEYAAANQAITAGLPLAGQARAPALEARLGARQIYALSLLGRNQQALVLIPFVKAALARAEVAADVEAEVYRSIGVVQRATGNYDLARRHYEKATALFERSGSTLELVATLTNLADSLYRQKDYPGAIDQGSRALVLAKDTLGPQHPYVAAVLNGLALAYHAVGRTEKAMGLWLEVLAVIEQAYGPRSFRAAVTCTNIAEALDKRGGFEEAEKYHRRALRIGNEQLPSADSMAGIIAHNFGAHLNRRKQYEAALPHHERAVETFAAVHGDDHEYTGVALIKLGVALRGVGDRAASRAALQRGYAILEGEDSEYLPDAKFALARQLWDSTPTRSQSLDLARAAREAWRQRGDREWDLRRVEDWIRERAGGPGRFRTTPAPAH